MVKNNLIFTFFGMLIVGVIVGLAIGRHQGAQDVARQLRENEKIRIEAAKKQDEIWELRRVLAHERKAFEKEINKSIRRYDSLEEAGRRRQARLLQEIGRLKGSSVKELEDEAERIYRGHTDHN